MSRVSVDISYDPRPWQHQCHKSLKRFSVLALHRRAGKTELAIMELIDRAVACQLDMPLYIYLAPYLRQAKAIAWSRLKQKLSSLVQFGAVTINEGELIITLNHNKAKIRVYGGDNPDAMRGMRIDGVVIDEVAQIKPEVWNDIIQPALSDRKGWALFIGTPNGINLFSELYFKSVQYPDDWYSAKYTVYDTHAIDCEEVERLRRDMSETSFAREYLCDFSASGEDQLISLADVDQAANRMIYDADIAYAPLVIGVDPARFGDDRSVIMMRKGLVAKDPIIFNGIDNMQLADRVAGLIAMHEPDAVFVDSGQGAGVIDRLRQLGHDVIEVPFSAKPSNPLYLNKRAEMWFEMKEWLKAGSIPNISQLKQELATPIYFHTSAGKIQLEPKDDIKSRGLPSPDIADALALTFASPVSPKPPGYLRNNAQTAAERMRGHDPFKRP